MIPSSSSSTLSWKRNLIALWIAQVGTTLGFSFTFPFYPIFFEEIGGFSTESAAFWAGMAGWVFGIGMGLFSPIWGGLGDKYGRKLNIIRAMFLGGFFLTISGFAETPMQLLVSRFFVGATSGVVPTIMALVAAHTPREKLPFASGAVQSALFLGIALGPLFGGLIYDAYGMTQAFVATGAALWLSGILVIIVVKEDFQRPNVPGGTLQSFVDMWLLSTSRAMLPLYLVILLVLASNLVIQPAIPGLVESVEGGSDSGTASGIVFTVMGMGAAISSLLMGFLAGKFGIQRMLIIAAVAASLTSLIPYFALDYWALAFGLLSTSLFAGGLGGMVNGLIAMRSPAGRHGAAFGAAQFSHAVGVAIGPLVGGFAVITLGLRSVFLIDIAGFSLILLVVLMFLRTAKQSSA